MFFYINQKFLLLFSKDLLNWSKVTVKTFVTKYLYLKKIYIFWTVHQRILKDHVTLKTVVMRLKAAVITQSYFL